METYRVKQLLLGEGYVQSSRGAHREDSEEMTPVLLILSSTIASLMTISHLSDIQASKTKMRSIYLHNIPFL